METCVRGFSFMSDSKVDLVDLQYIEGGELERTWRSTRRERMKQREQRIWDEFVKERDIVQDVCHDDPYQFLDQLPQSCLKEIMEKELQKMTQESAEEEIRVKAQEVSQQGNGDSSTEDESQHTCVVTFADEIDKDDCDMFHIFDDEQSGPEDEIQNESRSPSTVREITEPENQSSERIDVDKTSSKSSENVTNLIESSIYCAKVRDIRMKINEELLSLMTTLDRRDILSAEPEDITRMIRRSGEFCTRFNRIYMYQLQRQIHDIKRSNSISLPFAKHTQFQSQMVRIVSLHQNLLQAFQVFHKSFAQTCCVRESAGALGSLLAAVRDSTHMCINVPPPKDFAAATDLYKDEMITTCDKVDEFVNEYAIRCEEFLNSFENVNIAYSKKIGKNKQKKRSFGPLTRNSSKNDAEARLSMYSLDTLRLNLHTKSSSTKDNHMGHSSKMRGGISKVSCSNVKRGQQPDNNAEPTKSQRRSRRPLMRDPHAGRPRAPRPTRETDIRTMVEAVETCASSHISREESPSSHANTRRSKIGTPRRVFTTPRCINTMLMPAPVNKKRTQPSPTKPLPDLSPLKPKPRCPSPKPSNGLKVALSSIRTDQESIDVTQVTPVCKIQCAMKKDLPVVDEGAKYGDSSRRESSPKKLRSPYSREMSENEKKVREKSKSPNPCTQSPHRISHQVCKTQYTAKKDQEVDDRDRHGECSRSRGSPRRSRSPTRREVPEKKERNKGMMPDRYEVTRVLKQLCGGDAVGAERVTGAKNAQLLYVNSSSSPRQPSTPQLLRILEETIQKKVPKTLFYKQASARSPERYRLLFNISEKTADSLFQYRTKFVQHMLTSAMYANSAVGKPWEMIGSISEQIIDELLLDCMKEMELRDLMEKMYKKETTI